MTKEEYTKLTTDYTNKNLITVADLANKNNRVLLYGYTIERHTFKVELLDGDYICTSIEKYGEPEYEINVTKNEDYVPNKRVYPERSDYEFCKLLVERGVYIPWTVFPDGFPLYRK